MRPASILRLAGLLGGCSITGGCGGIFQVPYPAKAYFLVDPGRPADGAAAARGAPGPVPASASHAAGPATGNPAGRRSDLVLKVRQFRVTPPYDGTAFVCKIGPNQYTSDYYSAFLMPSDRMFSADVCDWLARSAVFTHVVDAGSSVRTRYSLEGNLSGFYADLTDRRAPRAVVNAQFSLLYDGDAGPEILFSHTYSISAPIKAGGPAGIVDAWDHACRAMLEELTADLARNHPANRDALAARDATSSR